MKLLLTLTTRLIVVAATFGCAAWALASSMPPKECTFTKKLVRSEASVVGIVTRTDTLPTDWSPGYRGVLPENRVSHLLVDETVFGP